MHRHSFPWCTLLPVQIEKGVVHARRCLLGSIGVRSNHDVLLDVFIDGDELVWVRAGGGLVGEYVVVVLVVVVSGIRP